MNEFSVCAVMLVAFGVVAIAGGLSAIKGRRLSLALAGAAMGMLGGGLIRFWLGFISIVLLFLSEGDF